jgi:hypothetical protein
MSLRQRLIDLPDDNLYQAGDLLSWDLDTWLLAGHRDPDILRLSQRWILTAFEVDGSITYHLDGYPLLSWNGAAWV